MSDLKIVSKEDIEELLEMSSSATGLRVFLPEEWWLQLPKLAKDEFGDVEPELVTYGEFCDIRPLAEVIEEEKKQKRLERDDNLSTLASFWIPLHAFEGRKGIIYESKHTGQRIFLKHINRKQHFMRKYNAWAVNEDILAELVKMKVEQIYINVKDEGLYMTSTSIFEEKSIIDEYGSHGMQAFLEEKFWEKVG